MGQSCSYVKQKDGDRWVWFRERPQMEDEDNVKSEEMSFRGGPTGCQLTLHLPAPKKEM